MTRTLAISHMKVNGGTFYGTRTEAKATTEQCFVCHAAGKTADIHDGAQQVVAVTAAGNTGR